jgi:hypothetical protein
LRDYRLQVNHDRIKMTCVPFSAPSDRIKMTCVPFSVVS